MKNVSLIFLFSIVSISLTSQNLFTLALPDPCGSVSSYQQIPLPYGWSIFSTYMDPGPIGLDSVLNEIDENLFIVKNGTGQVYWPDFNLNQIGALVIGQGYQIKMVQSDTLVLSGNQLVPEQNPINLSSGWNILGYLRDLPGPLDSVLSNITGIELIKNDMGAIYWPAFSVNQIGNFIPGEGYQIKLSSSQTLIYPPNNITFSKNLVLSQAAVYLSQPDPTGRSATLGIPLTAWEILPSLGDEIGAYDSQERLVGSAVFDGGFTCFTLWGDDAYSAEKEGLIDGDEIFLKIWKSGNEAGKRADRMQYQASELLIKAFTRDGHKNLYETGPLRFQENEIYLIHLLSANQDIKRDYSIRIFPNPLQNTGIIWVHIPVKGDIKLEIFDLQGHFIEMIASGNYEAGDHSFIFNGSHIPVGNYYCRFMCSDVVLTNHISIVR